ncbi:hypothetical protein ACVBKF_00235 [Shewanella sp. 0m-11]
MIGNFLPINNSKTITNKNQAFQQLGAKLRELFHSTLRLFIYPFRILQIGFHLFTLDMIKAVSIFSFMTLPIILQNEFPQLDPALALSIVYSCIVFSILVSAFAPPSSFCTSGVKLEHINDVASLLCKENISSFEVLAPIKNNISLFESRVQQRIMFLRGFLALIWAGYLFIISKLDLEVLSKKAEVADILFITISLLIILFLYMIIEAYSKTKTLIFRTIQFGCNEFEYSLQQSTSNLKHHVYS